MLGLHPIIREFVRTSFPREDREKYVGTILDFLDRMIGRFKPMLSQEPSYEILEHWTRKAELKITFGRFEEATSIIAEIALPLVNRGYSEKWSGLQGVFSAISAGRRRVLHTRISMPSSNSASLK